MHPTRTSGQYNGEPRCRSKLLDYLYTAAQARELDRIAIQERGIAGFELMLRAGRAAFAALLNRWPDAGSVTISYGATGASVVSADANPGWVATIEYDEPGEADVKFEMGDDRVDFDAQIEDGALRVRIRDRRLEDVDDPSVDEPDTEDPDEDDDDPDSSTSTTS